MTDPLAFSTFGEMLRFLRRRARLTQRDLGIAIGYSEGHVNRFEKSRHLPDPATVTALFIPALQLEREPELAARLIELAQTHDEKPEEEAPTSTALFQLLEPIPPAPPFEVARSQALARLRTRLSTERRILLSGMAGVGKTALAAALARETVEVKPVFWLTLTAGATTSVDTLAHQLALFLSEQGNPQVKALVQSSLNQPGLASDRVLALLAAGLNRQPVLLCLDNAESISDNEPILHVLRYLCTTTTAEIILTSRESLPLPGICEIALAGLARGEGISLVSALTDRLDIGQAARLFEKTGGNPMLIRLAVAHLIDDDRDATGFIDRLDAQPTVASYLLETVQKQSTPAQWSWLSLLAVFFKPVDLYDERLAELVQSLGGAQETSAAIVNLQRRHLIDDPSRAELNPLVRDYIYRALGADAKRRRLHRLAGDWYAGNPAAALAAATHYAEADLVEETVEIIALGEKGIIARGEASAAVAVLDQARAQAVERRGLGGDTLRRLLTIRGALLTASARSVEAEANLQQALSLATNPAIRADLVYRLSWVMAQHGRYAEALDIIEGVRVELPSADLLLSAQLAVAEGRICDVSGDHARAQHSAEQAIRLANQVANISLLQAEEIRAESYYSLANVARRNRQVDAAIEYAQCAMISSHRAGQRIREVASFSFIGGMLYDSGDLEGSLRYRRDALAGAQAIDDQVGVGLYLVHLADIDEVQLRPDEALKKLDLAVPILTDTGETRGLASALALSARCSLLQGNVRQAEATILRVIAEMEGPATRRAWGSYLGRYACILMVEGKYGEARSTLEGALKLEAVAADRMLHFELETTWALIQAIDGHPPRSPRLAQAIAAHRRSEPVGGAGSRPGRRWHFAGRPGVRGRRPGRPPDRDGNPIVSALSQPRETPHFRSRRAAPAQRTARVTLGWDGLIVNSFVLRPHAIGAQSERSMLG